MKDAHGCDLPCHSPGARGKGLAPKERTIHVLTLPPAGVGLSPTQLEDHLNFSKMWTWGAMKGS